MLLVDPPQLCISGMRSPSWSHWRRERRERVDCCINIAWIVINSSVPQLPRWTSSALDITFFNLQVKSATFTLLQIQIQALGDPNGTKGELTSDSLAFFTPRLAAGALRDTLFLLAGLSANRAGIPFTSCFESPLNPFESPNADLG